MKNPLYYQHTEYDCGPTSMLNAISFLFEREEIPPEIIRNIMLYCLDCYGAEGSPGENGTSCTAMMFLSNWLDGFGQTGRLPISCRYLSGNRVYISEHNEILDALRLGGAVVIRLYHEVAHYVLLTGIRENEIMMFDPYYQEEDDPLFKETDIEITLKHPFTYNRIVPFHYFNQETHDIYALGELVGREAVLLYNKNTRLTDEKTIEYFI